MRCTALAGAVLVLWATVASAAPTLISDDDLRWQIDLPDTWSAVSRDELESGKALAAFVSGRRRFVLLRLRGNTDGAFDAKPAFFTGLEDGVKKEVPDFRRVSGTIRKLGPGDKKTATKKKTPGYDLWYRTGDSLRGVRFIFLKNYCLMGTIDLPGATSIPREAQKLLESLVPALPL